MPEDDITAMADQVVAKLVEIDASIPAPVFVPLPDDEVGYDGGLIGHLDGIGVRSLTRLKRTIDGSDGPFETTTTAYALEDGVVRNVDEWGDHSDHLDLDVDEAHLAVQMLEDEGWEVVDFETVDSRLRAAREQRGPSKNPAHLHLSGFRQWGFEVRYDFGRNGRTTELFWCDPGEDDQVAQAKAAGYRQEGHTVRLMCRAVGKAEFFDSSMYTEPNEHGRCRWCDGTTGVCQKCRQPMHGPEAGHLCSALPCRGCNGGAYPVRLAEPEKPNEGRM